MIAFALATACKAHPSPPAEPADGKAPASPGIPVASAPAAAPSAEPAWRTGPGVIEGQVQALSVWTTAMACTGDPPCCNRVERIMGAEQDGVVYSLVMKDDLLICGGDDCGISPTCAVQLGATYRLKGQFTPPEKPGTRPLFEIEKITVLKPPPKPPRVRTRMTDRAHSVGSASIAAPR